ncbi:MAG: putative bifunctional diguanylate cyclase/phosphodiesterase [Actinomycetales bacterium]
MDVELLTVLMGVGVFALISVLMARLVVRHRARTPGPGGALLGQLAVDDDPLTGLASRAVVLRRLSDALRSSTAATPVSVALIGLHGVKQVNATRGYAVGDALLRTAAQRLVSYVADSDTAGRVGGNEFAMILPGRTAQQVEQMGEHLRLSLGHPFVIEGQEVWVGANVGVTHWSPPQSAGRLTADDRHALAEDLLREADIAMLAAGDDGRGTVRVVRPDLWTQVAHRAAMRQDLAHAVQCGEIEVEFQPIMDLRSQRPIRVEALARWRRRGGQKPVPAELFIPVAEETGAIVDIGHEVMRQACRAVQRWRRTIPGCEDLGVAVNVCMRQLQSGHLVEHVADVLEQSDLPPDALTLEVTETSAMEHAGGISPEITSLREYGVKVAIDDFGAGYFSLGLVLGVEPDVLKIDRTVLHSDTSRGGSLVSAITELGHYLGVSVVVEGVETAEQLACASAAGADAAQGYHYCRPQSFGRMSRFLAKAQAGPVTLPVNKPRRQVDLERAAIRTSYRD